MVVHEGYIDKIIIDRFTDEEIEKFVDCNITNTFTNFIQNTVYDHHLGVTLSDRNKNCETCSSQWVNCIGGFGVIKLPFPYYLPINSKYILTFLNDICQKCSLSKLICTCENGPELKQIYKFKKHLKTYTWDFCKYNEPVHPTELKNLLDNAYKGTIHEKLIKSFFLYNLLVTPIYTRHGMLRGGANGHILHNDTTTLYNLIIKDLKRSKIHYHQIYDKIYTMLFDRSVNKTLPNSSKIIKSSQARIQSKDGIINANINGRRCNHSSRANITGFPDGKLGFIGVPDNILQKMSYSCTVMQLLTKLNILPNVNLLSHQWNKYLKTPIIQEKILNWIRLKKPINIKREDGSIFNFINEKTTKRIVENLEITDVIERRLEDGDTILFNRQPSIRTESIISNKIKKIEDIYTFRLNLACTPPLNADFDGDESNAHILMSVKSNIEAYDIMNPSEMLISSQRGTPIIMPVQDAILGIYLISDINTFISRAELNDIIMVLSNNVNLRDKLDDWNKINPDYKLNIRDSKFPGKFCISLLFDRNFFFNFKDLIIINGCCKYNNVFINKKLLCSGVKCIIHKYYFDIGKKECCTLIDDIQFMTNKYLIFNSFSVGLSDCNLPKVMNFSRKQTYSNTMVNTILGQLEMKLKKKHPNLLSQNNLVRLVQSGAKASFTNICQISQCIGQQSMDGSLIESELESNRTLSQFDYNDKSSFSKGFVINSFYDGLSWSENIFHSKIGRQGVAVNTTKIPEIGYLEKKISKFMEDLVIKYDYTVRNIETNQIISFMFGNDGFKPNGLPGGSLSFKSNHVFLNLTDLENLCLIKFNQITDVVYGPNKEFLYSILINLVNDLEIGLKKTRNNNIIKDFKNSIITNIFEQLEDVKYVVSNQNILKIKHNINSIKILFNSLILSRMFSPGCSIGLITSKNIVENSSQLLMNYTHLPTGNLNISSGVKRLNQLLNRSSEFSVEDQVCIGQIDEKHYNILRNYILHGNAKEYENCIKIMLEDRIHYLLKDYINLQFKSIIDKTIYSYCLDCECSMTKNCIHKESPESSESIESLTETTEITTEDKMENKKYEKTELNRTENNKSNNKLSYKYIIYKIKIKTYIPVKECYNIILSQFISSHGNLGGSIQLMEKDDDDIKIIVKLSRSKDLWNDYKELNLVNETLKNGYIKHGSLNDYNVVWNSQIKDYDIILKNCKLQQALHINIFKKSTLISLDPFDILKILDIEACRMALLDFLINILNFDTNSINNRYIILLSETMTFSGTIIPINNPIGTLSAALFEREIKKLNILSLDRSIDYCKSMQSKVVLGQVYEVGTNYTKFGKN